MLGRPTSKLEDDIKMDLKQIRREVVASYKHSN
jgi:hypothetical protein